MAEEFSKVWSGLNKVNLTPSPGESKGGTGCGTCIKICREFFGLVTFFSLHHNISIHTGPFLSDI